jgi:glutaconate CoA-transferase subunit B
VGSFSKRLLITMAGGRFVEKLDYVTTPGWLDGGDSRRKAGLPGGPEALITKKAIFRFHPETKEMYLDARYPWVSVEEIRKEIPWDLKVAEDGVKVAPLPTPEQLRFIREFSPLTALRRDYYLMEKITERHWMLEPSEEPLLTRIVEIRDEDREAIKRRIEEKRRARGSFFKKEIERWRASGQ